MNGNYISLGSKQGASLILKRWQKELPVLHLIAIALFKPSSTGRVTALIVVVSASVKMAAVPREDQGKLKGGSTPLLPSVTRVPLFELDTLQLLAAYVLVRYIDCVLGPVVRRRGATCKRSGTEECTGWIDTSCCSTYHARFFRDAANEIVRGLRAEGLQIELDADKSSIRLLLPDGTPVNTAESLNLATKLSCRRFEPTIGSNIRTSADATHRKPDGDGERGTEAAAHASDAIDRSAGRSSSSTMEGQAASGGGSGTILASVERDAPGASAPVLAHEPADHPHTSLSESGSTAGPGAVAPIHAVATAAGSDVSFDYLSVTEAMSREILDFASESVPHVPLDEARRTFSAKYTNVSGEDFMVPYEISWEANPARNVMGLSNPRNWTRAHCDLLVSERNVPSAAVYAAT